MGHCVYGQSAPAEATPGRMGTGHSVPSLGLGASTVHWTKAFSSVNVVTEGNGSDAHRCPLKVPIPVDMMGSLE